MRHCNKTKWMGERNPTKSNLDESSSDSHRLSQKWKLLRAYFLLVPHASQWCKTSRRPHRRVTPQIQEYLREIGNVQRAMPLRGGCFLWTPCIKELINIHTHRSERAIHK